MHSLKHFKSQFFRHPSKLATNNAGLSPYPLKAHELIKEWSRRFYEEGVHCDAHAVLQSQMVRSKMSQFLNCKPEELAFTQSTANSISQVALGLKLKPGDEIITWEQEYPSSFYPWSVAAQRSDARLVVVPSAPDWQTPVQALLKKITSRTRVIGISWVQYQTGAVTELAPLVEAARAQDIWIVVDGIQGVGVRPFDFEASGIDALCGGTHKWMCAPLSTGYLAVSEKRLAELEPIVVGALTFGTSNDRPDVQKSPRNDALKFEPGAKSFLTLLALEASLDLFMQTGLSVIASEAERLNDQLREGLNELGAKVYSPDGPIVTFYHEKQKEIEAAFQASGIAFAARGPGLRLSLHAFNEDSDAQKILQVIKDLL